MLAILVLLECVNSCQCNGKTLIFMCCVVLELQLFSCVHAGFVTGNVVVPLSEMYI